MNRTWFSIVTALVGAAVWMAGTHALSQESNTPTSRPAAATTETATSPATAEAGSASRSAQATASTTKPKEFRGRLPAYFGRVVDEQQRQQIYAIQKEYFEQINALKAKLAALIQEQRERIDGVLSEEQRQQVDEMKEEARAKRRARQEK